MPAAQQHWPEAERRLREALDLANAVRAYAALLSETATHEKAGVLWTDAASLDEAQCITAGIAECRRVAETGVNRATHSRAERATISMRLSDAACLLILPVLRTARPRLALVFWKTNLPSWGSIVRSKP